MINVEIQKVRFDDNRIFIVPLLNYAINVECQYVYRSAMGVYWNPKEKYFYIKRPGDITAEKQFAQILLAVNEELGFEMTIIEKTLWQNVSAAVKNKICNCI